jgi:hypothetical protein
LNILILGTSNSLLRGGWAAGLREVLPRANIKNMSIGASPGIQFGVHIAIDFTKYHFVFFDSIPNDEQFLYGTTGSSRLNFSNRILYEIFQTISLQTNLIVLGFCIEQFLIEKSEQFLSVMRLAALCSCQFVDVRQLVLDFGSHMLGNSPLYGDSPTHPATKIAFEIGRALGLELKRYGVVRKRTGLRNWASNFSNWIPDDDWSAFSRYTLSNNLLSETFSKLSAEDRFSLFPDRRCIGFYINMRGSSCDLLIKKDTHIRLYYRLEENKLIKIFVPIPNGQFLRDVRVSLSSDKPSFVPISSAWNRHDEDSEVCLSVSQFLFWAGQEYEDSFPNVDDTLKEEALQLNKLVSRRVSNLVQEGYFITTRK